MFNPDLHLKIKHAEECLETLVGESRFDKWIMGLPHDIDNDPALYYRVLHREIFQIRASAINDASRRKIVIISQYFPRLGINAR